MHSYNQPVVFIYIIAFFFFFLNRGFLFVALARLELAGLELKDLPSLAFQVLKLKVYATMPSLFCFVFFLSYILRMLWLIGKRPNIIEDSAV